LKAARRVMFSSYIYLPLVLLALLANKLPVTGIDTGRIVQLVQMVTG